MLGRSYAGFLGLLAFATSVLRGLLLGDDVSPTLTQAISCLVGFAALGWIVGRIGEAAMVESVQAGRRSR